MSGSLFVISAASGTGKTSLVKELLETTPNLTVSVSHTTRSPRPGETDGVHYHFTNADDFKNSINAGDFIEYAQVFDNFYGTKKSSVEQLLAQGTDVILEIDWQGAKQVKKIFPDCTSIFILPPSQEALRERLSNRGQDSQEVIEKRLLGSFLEMKQYVRSDYVVVNDKFDDALADIKAIVAAVRLTTKKQQINQQALINALFN